MSSLLGPTWKASHALRPRLLGTFLLIGLWPAPWVGHATATPLYPTHTDHQTGLTSIGVTIGDFNGDPNPDLVVASVNSNVLTVILGDGSGGVASSHNLSTGPAPRKIATGDWDQDGTTDLVVVVGGSHALAIHMGDGSGSFGEPIFYGSGSPSASDVVAGDLNEDGIADIAVANASIASTTILIGDGNGGFVVAESAPAGGLSLVASDLNGDAILDLAMPSRNGSAALVLIGRGDGTFDPALEFAVGREPVSIAVGDFNRDDHPDLVTANRGSPFTPNNTVSVLLGNAAGTFSPQTEYTVNSGPEWVAIGDLDGDQLLDVAVVHVLTSGVVSVLRGNGDGTLQSHEDYATGASPRHVTTGDLNRDGKLDLATANYADNTVSILINAGTQIGVGPAQAPSPVVRLAVAPNPIAPVTRLHLETIPGERVTVQLFNTRGSLVTTVYDGVATRGSVDIPWDANGANGAPLSSGIYFLRARSGSFVVNRQVVVAH